MKVLGIVQWTTRDKGGSPIAGVRPIVEILKSDWRQIEASEEFPSQGQVFWPNAQFAVEGGLVSFRIESNPGQKDEFKVIDPKPVHEVLDLRGYGIASRVYEALVSGALVSDPIGTMRPLVWSEPNTLIGPVELSRDASGRVRLSGNNLHHLPIFDAPTVRSVVIDRYERLVRVDDAPPTGYVDWDTDVLVLRRALEAAAKIAKQAGGNVVPTKRQIEEATRALIAVGIGAEAKLDRYRLTRALDLTADTEVIADQAEKLVEILTSHPSISEAIDSFKAKISADIEDVARTEVAVKLSREYDKLAAMREDIGRAAVQLESANLEISTAEDRLSSLKNELVAAAEQIDPAIEKRILAAIERPVDLLAEVSVLRPLLAGQAQSSGRLRARAGLNWGASRGESVGDRTSLRRMLLSAARARSVDPALLLTVHASVVARLVPVTLGPSALAALIAYGNAVAGSRVLVLSVSPSALLPQDLDKSSEYTLRDAAEASIGTDGISLVILEGANRSPIEGSLLPLLQLADVGLSPFGEGPGIRLAATLVVGATTVPITPQLWSHAVAIRPDPASNHPEVAAIGQVPLSGELFAPGDAPVEVIDALFDAWPICSELRSTAERFGSALSRFYDDDRRITDALLQSLVLPYIGTALTVEEQTDALMSAGDPEGSLATSLARLRRVLS